MRVRVSDEFFKKERDQAYSDWREAVWRELFQNSIDQKASVIRIQIRANVDQSNGSVLEFDDNGPGMTREVLDNVYFALGATTKTGPDTIGGMGRARVLTCFAMKSYRIRSHNYEVIGKGGDYEVVDTPDFYKGCKLTIEADDATIDVMAEKLISFMKECRIQATVYVNDNRVRYSSDLLGKFLRNLDYNNRIFGKVYVNKSSKNHRVIVRVNGVSMFTMRTAAKAQIVVELEPSVSRDVLTSNRDGLRWMYREVLDTFVQEVAVNTNAALRPRIQRNTTVSPGGGFLKMTAKRPVSSSKGSMNVSEFVQAVALFAGQTAEPVVATDVDTSSHWADTYEEQHVDRDYFGEWLRENFGDIYIYDETEKEAIRKVMPNYLPKNWVQGYANGKTFRKGGNIAKVLLMWKTAISYALEVAMPHMNLNDIEYSVGFVFADDRLAEHKGLNGGHVFNLHPVDDNGKLRFSVREKASLKRLMTYAKHEVTHVTCGWHNEDYTTMRETIDTVFDESECFRRMKDALNNVPDWD